jgi:hypothetical protein
MSICYSDTVGNTESIKHMARRHFLTAVVLKLRSSSSELLTIYLQQDAVKHATQLGFCKVSVWMEYRCGHSHSICLEDALLVCSRAL